MYADHDLASGVSGVIAKQTSVEHVMVAALMSNV